MQKDRDRRRSIQRAGVVGLVTFHRERDDDVAGVALEK
jgi:hypothetical protein